MHNIRPTGQMWPAEAFNLARRVKKFIHLACLLEKTPSKWVRTNQFRPLVIPPRPPPPQFFLAHLSFEFLVVYPWLDQPYMAITNESWRIGHFSKILESYQIIQSQGVVDNDEVGQLGAGLIEDLDQLLIIFAQISQSFQFFLDSDKVCVPSSFLKLRRSHKWYLKNRTVDTEYYKIMIIIITI